MKGLYKKYNIAKTSGKPLDPNFFAIVLRIDGGQYVHACREGVRAFAKAVKPLNPDFAFDLELQLLGYVAEEHKEEEVDNE